MAAAFVQTAGGGGGAGEGKRGGTLRLASPVWLGTVDPALAFGTADQQLLFVTCAKLFNLRDAAGAAGTRVVPEVATGFPRVSRDGRTYTFELKQTFRFHTGAPVTAQSFAQAFNRDADPKMRSPGINFMHEIVGVDAVSNGKATSISGVRVLGPYRLRIRLEQPLGDFTARLTMGFFCPLLPSTRVDPAGIDDPPGSGPYYVAERVVNRQVVLRRNRFYRGGRPANVDQIVYTVTESRDACVLAIEQDRIDFCYTSVPDATVRRIVRQYGINRPGGQFFVTPALGTWFFAFNHDRPAFKGPGQIPLKKAINYAIDRHALARAFGYLFGKRTDQLLPPALGRDASVYPLGGADPATARKWLEKARVKPSPLVLYASNSAVGVAVAQVFEFDLKQIGIVVDVKYFAFNGALHEKAATRGEPFDVVFLGWGADYPDGADFFGPLLEGKNLRPTNNTNFSYFDDATTNAAIAAANGLTGEARRKAWSELDADLMRSNPPLAPFIHGTRLNFVSKSFGCFLDHPVYGVDLAAACKK